MCKRPKQHGPESKDYAFFFRAMVGMAMRRGRAFGSMRHIRITKSNTVVCQGLEIEGHEHTMNIRRSHTTGRVPMRRGLMSRNALFC